MTPFCQYGRADVRPELLSQTLILLSKGKQTETQTSRAVYVHAQLQYFLTLVWAIMIVREKSWLSFQVISLIAMLAIMALIKKQITQTKTRNEEQASFLLSLSTKLLEIQSNFREADEKREIVADTNKHILGVYVSEQKKLKKSMEHLQQKIRMIFEDPYSMNPTTKNQNITLTSAQRLRNIQQSIKEHQILLDILEAQAKNQIRKERIRTFDKIAQNLTYFQDEKRRNYWLMQRGNMLNPLLQEGDIQQIQKLYRAEEPRLEQTYNLSHYSQQLPFCIVVPSFNNAKNYRFEFNIQSILNQKYSNYHVIIIDDASEDSTGLLIKRFLKRNSIPQSKVEVVINNMRVTAVPNIHMAITRFCKPNEIAFFVDGDDEIISRKAFQIFNAVYQAKRPAIAYSISLEYWLEEDMVKDGWSLPYKEEEKANNSYREVAQKISHLRSFRVDLYLEIKENDLKNKEGEWFNSTYDEVICLPMLEMSCGNIEYIDEHLYFYAYGTGLNDRQVDDKLQYSIAQYVRKQMPKYRCLPKFAKQQQSEQK